MDDNFTDIKELVAILKSLDNGVYKNERRIEDVYGLNLLQSLMIGYPYLAFTGSSMRPFCLAHIINDIIINKRSKIVEFGSGISTVVLARLIKRNSLNAQIISIEHDIAWVEELENRLAEENLMSMAKIIYAPLVESYLALEKNMWYDTRKLDEVLKYNKFDMVIIDGPPAALQKKGKARYPALPYIINYLEESFSIYLDDSNREGERSVLSLWEKDHNFLFKLTGESLAFYRQGPVFFTEPISDF